MGRRLSFSNGRRLVDDVIRVSNQMPMAAFSSEWDVAQIAKLRRMAKPKISWNVLMMKAHAIVCLENPMLRRNYVRFPFPHLYEHHQTVCMMTIGRQHQGEERLFLGTVRQVSQGADRRHKTVSSSNYFCEIPVTCSAVCMVGFV